MEHIKSFLESSTIHGLTYISTGSKYVRLSWVLVVIAGFTGAGVMIYQSFQSWDESPVKTTIETRPIKEINFPKVTVCPPKNTFTDLNYDLMVAENMNLDNDTRRNLNDYALELILDDFHSGFMAELNKLQEKDRYYNWYHGHSKIWLDVKETKDTRSTLETSATSGAIFTQYYGDKFDADKLKKDMVYSFAIIPNSDTENANVTLCIETVQMVELSRGVDQLMVLSDKDYRHYRSHHEYSAFRICDWFGVCDKFDLKEEKSCISLPREGYNIYIIDRRNIRMEDVRKHGSLDSMPGTRVTWYYSGLKVQPVGKFNDTITKSFARYP